MQVESEPALVAAVLQTTLAADRSFGLNRSAEQLGAIVAPAAAVPALFVGRRVSPSVRPRSPWLQSLDVISRPWVENCVKEGRVICRHAEGRPKATDKSGFCSTVGRVLVGTVVGDFVASGATGAKS